MHIAVLAVRAGRGKDTAGLRPFRSVLPVDRAQRDDVPVEEDAGDMAACSPGLDSVPSAQHECGAVQLEMGQALLSRPRTGGFAIQPALQAYCAPHAPVKVLTKRDEDRRVANLGAVAEPKTVIALVVGNNNMKAVAGQLAEKWRVWIRKRRSCKAVRGSRDNKRGREVSGQPDRMRGQCRRRRVGWETPPPNDGTGALWPQSSSCRRQRSATAPRHSPAGIACCGGGTRT